MDHFVCLCVYDETRPLSSGDGEIDGSVGGEKTARTNTSPNKQSGTHKQTKNTVFCLFNWQCRGMVYLNLCEEEKQTRRRAEYKVFTD